MPNITARKNKNGDVSYLIRVFVDEKSNGRQTMKSLTYKPESGMTKRQIEKKLNETAVMFEKQIKSGIVSYDGRVKFEDYAARWLENSTLAPKTRSRYESLLVRINMAIGGLKLQNIQAHHLEAFYKNLAEAGIKEKGKFAVMQGLEKIMNERCLTKGKLSQMAGVAASTVGVAHRGNVTGKLKWSRNGKQKSLLS